MQWLLVAPLCQAVVVAAGAGRGVKWTRMAPTAERAPTSPPLLRARLQAWHGIALLTACFVLLALAYAAAIPHFEGPDEEAHLRYILHLRQTRALPRLDAASEAASHELVQQPPLFYAAAALLTAWTPLEQALAYPLPSPYYDKSLSRRVTATPPGVAARAAFPLALARFVSTLGGALAVVGTWRLARLLLPGEPAAALAAAAAVGLNPQFLFSSATVTNDAWAAALSVWAVASAVQAVAQPERRWLWALSGALAGLAALTKYSALALGAPLAFCLVLHAVQQARAGRRALPALFRTGLAAGAGFLAVAGFWFARNLLLYGAAVPLEHMRALMPAMARDLPLAWGDETMRRGVAWLLRSYWGVYGYGIVAPARYHAVVQTLVAAGALGLLLAPLRWLLDRRQARWPALGVGLLWFGLAFAGLLKWMRIMHYTDQGRLLFVAAPAAALLLVLGWRAWLPRPLQPWLLGALPLLMAGLALWQWGTLRDAYAQPPALPAPAAFDRPLDASFDAGMRLLGADLPAGAALAPDETLPLRLYFSADRPIEGYYTLFVHLAGAEERLLWQYDGVPAQGRHPTRQWQPGAVFADDYRIQVGEVDAEQLAWLSLGFYDYDDPAARRSVLDAQGVPVADRVLIAPVWVHPAPAPAAPLPAPRARWQGGILLLDAQVSEAPVSEAPVSETQGAEGAPLRVTLTWGADRIVRGDYTVFVHLLDAAGNVLAQVDRPPAFPTSTWRAGDRVLESYTLVPADPAAPWQRVVVGLYDGTLQRLPLDAPAEPATLYTLAER